MKRIHSIARLIVVSMLVTGTCGMNNGISATRTRATTAIATTSFAVVVSIPAKQYAAGETVVAQLVGSGQVGVESEFAQASSSHTVNGSLDVPIGVAKSEGLHIVRFSGAAGDRRFLVSVLKSGNRYSVSGESLSGASTSPVPASLLERFWKALTYTRLKAAAAAEVPKWIVAHHQGVAVTVVICLIPGQQVTCALGTGQHVIDVGTSILAAAVDSMAKDGLISAQEATLLKATVGIGKVIVQVAMASNLLERVMTLGAAGAEVVLPSDNAKAALTITTDVAGKYSTFYKVLKSVP